MSVTWHAYQVTEIFRRMSNPVPRVTWTPARYVRDPQVCSMCFNIIPNGRPGATTGTRGTKAWYCPEHQVWECLDCHTERTDAELACRTS